MSRALWLLGMLAACSACSVGAPGPSIDVDRAMGHVGSLMLLGPRPGDTDASRRAAAYIERELQAAGASVERQPVGAVDLPAIEVLGQTYRSAHRVVTSDENLVVRFGPRQGAAVLVMAHYDTVRDSPGAVDNAAADAVVIELARALVATPPTTPVILAFTANEEIGLVGAEALAAKLGPEISFAIALDLIGGSGELTINGASRWIGTPEMRWIADAADRAGVILRAPLAHRVVSRWWPQAERSDHGPFTRRGIRALHLYHRGQDGDWIDLAYHTSADGLGRVHRASLDELGRVLLALLPTAPPAHGTEGFWLPVVANAVIPRWLLIAIELLFAAIAIGSLVSQRTSRARGGLGALVGVGCFAVTAAITVACERLTAADHAAPWLHAPVRHEIALGLVVAGTFGLVTLLARRIRPWIGALRYLVIATVIPLVIGSVVLAIGAAELAWIWLLPAAVMALAPRLGPARVLGPLALLLPVVLVLAPNQVREAAWNGFLPTSVPLTAWMLGLGAPALAGVAWWFRRRGAPGPLGAFVLPMGCLLAITAGVLVLSHAHPGCSGTDFNQFQLACERSPGVR
ncbi:MAG: peptidase [Myxococcales bacterium]|nr:peptidase [Myxococcales bacterium]